MITKMATRDPQGAMDKQGTAFVMHKSHQEQFSGIMNKIADFTEYKLIKYAMSVSDKQQKLELIALIQEYRAGNVAISWCKGRPNYLRVTRNA